MATVWQPRHSCLVPVLVPPFSTSPLRSIKELVARIARHSVATNHVHNFFWVLCFQEHQR